MTNTQQSPSHRKLTVVVATAAVVIVLALLSAFVWPGWAMSKNTDIPAAQQTTSSEPTKPSIESKPLPDGSTELLKAMPDSVLNFARTAASPSANWNASSPLEEYTLTYGTGNDAQNITLIVGQWASADNAKKQYDSLVSGLKGTELASGNVKVSGNNTGSYVVKSDETDSKKAVGVWQNDTAVFEITGEKAAVERFYQKFPM